MMQNEEQQNNIQRYIDNYWLGIGDISQYDNLEGPLCEPLFTDPETYPDKLFDVLLNPEYIGWVSKEFLNVEVAPIQSVILNELWNRPFPMLIGCRGMGKSFVLALYCMLKAFLQQGIKIVVVGAAFRQSKVLFEYMIDIWKKADILRDICGSDRSQGPHIDIDRCTMTVGTSKIIAIPIGNGQKIRGLRANIIISDEFASLNKEIFETVIAGFSVVSSSPLEKIKQAARRKAKEQLNIPVFDEEKKMGNQTIISGTAFYAFNHFYEYWKRWKQIIQTQGDESKLREIFGGEVPDKFDWKDYSILRIPVELLPDGFMDSKHIARARATVHSGVYLCEYSACFAKDSNGFFKRTLIESCVATDENVDNFPPGASRFPAMTRGLSNRTYVFGIDPASERDNFSIVIVELHEFHRRVVYVWTTTRERHREILNKGLTQEQDFYGYCGRKVRQLMQIFPCDRIMMDSQGGGVAVEEVLQDAKRLESGEKPIYQIIEEGKEKPTDDKQGLHILQMVNFADGKWTSEANHGMRKDMEDKVLLFPEFDPIIIGMAIEEDKAAKRLYDTLEDCYLEIEELKNELTSIVHTQTGAQGRDRWDTPEVKLEGGKKGRQHKDRYSALLMANMGARQILRAEKIPEYNACGGFSNAVPKVDGKMYNGPAWFTDYIEGVY